MRRLWFCWAFFLLLPSVVGCDDDVESDADGDVDGDADADSDVDGDHSLPI